jgi:guanosine-3',5'-bis(diphosphate) 3'-pyrophosphohydrolase
MRARSARFAEVADVFGFRVIVDTVDTCYRALGVVHQPVQADARPLQGLHRDPAANGYQSLHTVLFGPYGVPIEVQIRTEDMDRIAEARHRRALAVQGGDNEPATARRSARANGWPASSRCSSAGNSEEFIENVKVDLFPDEVYVFTPKGEILALPRGATCVDFAYAVHTDVGNRCVAAKIDRRLVPLRTGCNGQTVEIITAKGARPNPAGSIRGHGQGARRDPPLPEEPAAGQSGADARSLLDRTSLARLEELLRRDRARQSHAAAGRARCCAGMRRDAMPAAGEAAWRDGASLADHRRRTRRGGELRATAATRCRATTIMGYLSPGKGIVVHRLTCGEPQRNTASSPDRGSSASTWDRRTSAGDFSRSRSSVDVDNKPGVLAEVAAAIAEAIRTSTPVEYQERDLRTAVMLFVIEVKRPQASGRGASDACAAWRWCRRSVRSGLMMVARRL